jgi:hypothetical protein
VLRPTDGDVREQADLVIALLERLAP